MQSSRSSTARTKSAYNLEVQKLYEKEKVNPMSGCLWSFVPLLILLPLYAIIRQPLKYMMGVNSQDLLNAVANAVQWNSAALDMGWNQGRRRQLCQYRLQPALSGPLSSPRRTWPPSRPPWARPEARSFPSILIFWA